MNANSDDRANGDFRWKARRFANAFNPFRRLHRSSSLTVGAVLAVTLTLVGCAKESDQAAKANEAVAAATPGAEAKSVDEKRYPLTGEIVSVVPERKALLVHHQEIKGYMPSMTMEFVVSAGDLAVAKAGQHIRAEMVVGKNDEMRLEKIWPDNNTDAAAVSAGAQALRQDTLIRGKSAYREVGETLPDFTLYDQAGRSVQINRFRGKMVMINFIYTRCPIATMCPAATAKMMVTQKLAKDAGVKNLELISITLDPTFDTPGVLRDYADARGIDTSNFSFLTGPESAIKDLFEQFGVIAEFKGGLLTHSLATLMVDANGKIIHRADGSQWEPKDFVAKMER